VLGGLRAQAAAAGATIEAEVCEADDPAGGWVCAIVDPQGRRFRFVAGDRQFPERKPQPDQPVGLTHVNLNTSNIEAAADFFVRGLGMTVTDRTDHHNFLRCNSDHHSVVLANTKTNTINHIAFLMPDLESVMRRSGILRDHGHEIGWGVGRHGPGNNVFSYFESPLGFVVEVTAEVLQVDDAYQVKGPQDWAWPPGRTDHWGVTRPPTASLRAAQLAVPYGAPV
jgi:catechol 2,3-dioxygenase